MSDKNEEAFMVIFTTTEIRIVSMILVHGGDPHADSSIAAKFGVAIEFVTNTRRKAISALGGIAS